MLQSWEFFLLKNKSERKLAHFHYYVEARKLFMTGNKTIFHLCSTSTHNNL